MKTTRLFTILICSLSVSSLLTAEDHPIIAPGAKLEKLADRFLR